jgi:hypothetical protein
LKRLSIIVITALVLSLAVAGVAQAKVIHGKGVLIAHGKGVVRIGGKGKVFIKGAGTLYVTSLSSDTTVTVHGFGKKHVSGNHAVYVGRGTAKISGSHFRIAFVGRAKHLVAAGKGWANLRGRGRYHIGHHHGWWTYRGTLIRFSL